jgi:L-alanine-DL-glutamate epimerase-like enolase superfamily enzyme
MRIYCGLEIALYDLVGKRKQLPVSELLGGRVRDHIRLYGSGGMSETPQKHAAEAVSIAKLGFRAYKVRSALGPEQDLETVQLMREAVGPDFDLMIDAHTWWRMGTKNYSVEEVRSLAEQMANYGIAWLEEPLPPDDHEAYRELREAELVPIASGEHQPDEAAFLDLVVSRCVDYVQMDVVTQGGYAMARRLLSAIGKEGLRFAFHSWGTALEVIAAAHLSICWPATVAEWLEYPFYSTPTSEGMYPFPLAAEILKAPLTIDNGDLIVPRGPGLGVEVDEGVIERYPWIPGPWSAHRTESPDQTWYLTSDPGAEWQAPQREERQ